MEISMTSQAKLSSWWLIGGAISLIAGVALAQPVQKPLLNRDGGGVSPNVIMDIDDSGSMLYQHLPEDTASVGGVNVTMPGNRSLLMHPNDTRRFTTTFAGMFPADPASVSIFQKQMRSPDVNTLYYNPETLYKPWVKADATRFPNAVPSKAYFNPLVTTSSYSTITSVGVGTKVTAASGNVTPFMPGSLLAGDLVICLAESADLVTHTNSTTGWTQIYNVKGTTAQSASASYKIVSGSGEAAPTISHTSGSNIVAVCSAFRGVDSSQPLDVAYAATASATSNTTSDTTIGTGTTASVTANATVLIASHQTAAAGSFNVTTAGGLSFSQSSFAAGTGVTVGLHFANMATAGAVGSLVTTSNVGGRNIGVALVLRPGVDANSANLLAAPTSMTAQWCAASSGGCTSSAKVYAPGLYYRLAKSAGVYTNPTVAANYTTFDVNDPAVLSYTKYPSRTDCAGAVCTQLEEQQNFANWFVYFRARIMVAQAGIPEAFVGLDGTKIRVGWGRIGKGQSTIDGNANVATVEQGVRDFSTAQKTAMFSYLRNFSNSSSFIGGTPLPHAMYGVGDYYSKSSPWADDPSAPAVGTPKSCRRAYHVLVTDGYWNTNVQPFTLPAVANYDNLDASQINGDGRTFTYLKGPPYADSYSNTLADYAMYFWNRDLRSALDNLVQPSLPDPTFWQGMVNFTVGLGLTGTLNPATDLPALSLPVGATGKLNWTADKIDDLWHAAVNSQGKYFNARNATELAIGLGDALNRTLQNELKEAGVATSSIVLESGNRKYVPLYKTGVWSGDIRAFELDANGIVKPGAGVEGSLWSAEPKLPVWSSRSIYTWDPAAPISARGVAFTWGTISAPSLAAIGPATGTSTLVDYIRGDATYEQTAPLAINQLYRTRTTRLGDFINSNPVLAKGGASAGYEGLALGGSGTSVTTSYESFLAAKTARTGILYIGGNDGMLHAFKDTKGVVPADDGKEIFAYVPRAVYPNLSILSDTLYGTASLYHQFYVDGPLQLADAYVPAPGAASASWRNYLVGSLGSGGRAVFALDVTDPASLGASTIRWEYSSASDGDLGYVSAPVQVGVLPNGKWVALVGNGRFSTNGKAVLFVFDLETGAASKLVVDAVGSNGLGGIGVQRNSLGQITNLFAGDMKGQLWKLNYDAAATSTGLFSVDGSGPMFTATSASSVVQPITQAPAVFDRAAGGKLIVFGTGALSTLTEASSTEVQSIYAVWDKAGDTVTRPMTRSSLATRTISSITGAGGATFYSVSGPTIDWAGVQRGWVIDLDIGGSTGLRVLYPPQAVGKELVLISAVKPATGLVPCEETKGTGANFLLPVESGGNPAYKIFDTDGNGTFNSADQYAVGYATNSDGVDSVLYGTKTANSDGGGGGPADSECTRLSIQNTTGAMNAQLCRKSGLPGARVIKDRVWQRIINPPIR